MRVSYYLNKNTGLWCRVTAARDRASGAEYHCEHAWPWKNFFELIPRHQEKLALLMLLPEAEGTKFSILDGVGVTRKSKIHENFVYFRLDNEAWRKEL